MAKTKEIKLTKEQKQEVKKQVKEKVKQEVEKEVEKKLHQIIASTTKKQASKFKSEFKKQTITAITAAFAFLIALSWRVPIQKYVDNLKATLGLSSESILYEFIAAVFVTLIAVLALVLISSWTSKQKNQ